MSAFALTLVLIAACLHAGWNYITKRAKAGAAFLWLMSICAAVFYLPFVIYIFKTNPPDINYLTIGFGLLSGLIHLGYFLLLQRGYKLGDLSLVYPLARATGPLLASIIAILLFNERPTPAALLGGLCIIGGVFFLTGGHRPQRRSAGIKQSVFFGLMTGIFIGSYTIVDSYAVSVLLISPLILDYVSTLSRCLLLTPYAYNNQELLVKVWKKHHWAVMCVAIIAPLSYILVLTALVFTPVTYVAPAREISVLIVVFLGTKLLGEGNIKRRLGWASVILFGMVTLALN